MRSKTAAIFRGTGYLLWKVAYSVEHAVNSWVVSFLAEAVIALVQKYAYMFHPSLTKSNIAKGLLIPCMVSKKIIVLLYAYLVDIFGGHKIATNPKVHHQKCFVIRMVRTTKSS